MSSHGNALHQGVAILASARSSPRQLAARAARGITSVDSISRRWDQYDLVCNLVNRYPSGRAVTRL
jgi:hypothetical protein